MKKLLILPFLCLFFSLRAQDWFSAHEKGNWIEGFIITINGDTIEGFIQYDYPIVMQKRINFSSDPLSGEPVLYQPRDILDYSINHWVWESITVLLDTYNGPVEFNRFGLLSSSRGMLRLYRIFPEKDKLVKNYSITQSETILKNISIGNDDKKNRNIYLKKQEAPAESVNSKKFRKNFIETMAHLTSDYEELSEKIRNKTYTLSHLSTIVEEYNQWFIRKTYNRNR